jgi:NADPH:quinone reductase-like Zn-dependent oxidoreductase
LPKIPGTDIAGIVEWVPANCSEFQLGQEVYAMMPLLFWSWGATAEYAAVPISLLAPKPSSLNMLEAASLPLVGLTVMQGFKLVLDAIDAGADGLKNSKILVQAGSGGVGSMAVQYAKHGMH